MIVKRIFLKLSILAFAMSAAFLLSNCKLSMTPQKVTITYSTEQGTEPSAKTVNSGYKLTEDDLAPISAEGFVFDGWYIGSEKAAAGYAVTENITLTAKWEAKVTITYSTE